MFWAALALAPAAAAAQPGHEGHQHGSTRPRLNRSGTVQAFVLIVSAAVLFGAIRSILISQPWLGDASALPHARPARRRARRRAAGLIVGIIAGVVAHQLYHPADDGYAEDEAGHEGHGHNGEQQFGDMGHRALFAFAGAALGSLAGLVIPGAHASSSPGPDTETTDTGTEV